MERKVGGKFHLKLNIGSRPIVYKYHEGKMKRTLKRELKVPEIAEREANGTSLLGEIVARSGLACLDQRKRSGRVLSFGASCFSPSWSSSFFK